MCPSSLGEEHLRESFDRWWPDLKTELEQIQERPDDEATGPAVPPRSERAILEEVLDSVRGIRQPASSGHSRSQDFDRLNDDLQAILLQSGAHSWTVGYKSPTSVQVEIDGPVGGKLLDKLEALEKLRGVQIRLVSLGSLDPLEDTLPEP